MINQAARKFYHEVRSPSDGVTFLSRLAMPVDPRARQLHSWVWGKLPRVDLEHVFTDAHQVDVTVLNALQRVPGMSLHLEELVNLLVAVKATRAKRVLEVGTFDGNTALNLAANVPSDGCVITLDLPPDSDGGRALDVPRRFNNVSDRRIVGSQYRDTQHEAKIRQVFGDSTAVDWSTFVDDALDLVFIDGCHYRRYVESDTENALRHLSPTGVIVWHDYGYFKDVSDYVDELAQRFPVHAIAGTRLAIGRPRGR